MNPLNESFVAGRLEMHRGGFFRAALLLGAMALVCAAVPHGACYALEVILSDDAAVSSVQESRNFGMDLLLSVNGGSSGKKSFLKFDLSSLPTGTTGSHVAKATLRLFVNKMRTAGDVNVYRVTGDWSDREITEATAPALDSSPGAIIHVSQANVFVTADLTSLVSAWLDGTAPNQGIALAPSAGGVSIDLDSKENKSTSHEAKLEIVLVEPAGASNNQTRLLFPFVTNAGGFDTAIVIANTTSDPFGTSNAQGTCKIYYYASTAGLGYQTTATIQAGHLFVFNLSSGGVPGSQPFSTVGFQGYAIAVCNFPLAHGFYYIADQMDKAAAGGPALVLPSTRTSSSVESLGQ